MEHFSGIYTRAAESFTKMQQHNNQFNEDDEGPAPLDIGATTWKGKGKSKERHQRKGGAKGNKGKGFGNYHITGKGKYHNPIDQGNPFKGSKRKGKPSGNIKGKGKGKETCYKYSQQGHQKLFRVPARNRGRHSHHTDQPMIGTTAHISVMQIGTTRTSPNKVSQPSPSTGITSAAASSRGRDSTSHQRHEQHQNWGRGVYQCHWTTININRLLMIHSGATTHLCPPWSGTSFPLHSMAESSRPQLRTATNTNIHAYGHR